MDPTAEGLMRTRADCGQSRCSGGGSPWHPSSGLTLAPPFPPLLASPSNLPACRRVGFERVSLHL